jgi:hypothetical protein
MQLAGVILALEVVGEGDAFLGADAGELLATFGDDLVFVLGLGGGGRVGHEAVSGREKMRPPGRAKRRF